MRFLRSLLLVVLTVAAVLALLLVLLCILMPNAVAELRLGGETFQGVVTEQTNGILQRVKLNPLLDLAILVGAYVFVSLISWSQSQLASYLANRRHFS